MTFTFVTALALQLAAVAVLLASLGRSAGRYVGTYFVLIVVVYHGLSELAVRLGAAAPSTVRFYTTPESVDDFVLIVSGSLLVFAVAFVATIEHNGHKRGRSTGDAASPSIRLPWRMLAVLLLPLILAGSSGSGPAVLRLIAGQYLLLGAVFVALGAVLEYGRRLFWPATLFLILATLTTGQRLDTVSGVVLFLFALSLLRLLPSRRTLAALAALVVLATMSISAARAITGRAAIEAGSVPTRIAGVATGAAAVLGGGTPSNPTAGGGLATRLDGNSFGAIVLGRIRSGAQPVGISTFKNDLLLAVPSVIDPAKLSSNVSQRSEKVAYNERFNTGVESDFIPTQLGIALGYYGPLGLLVIGAILGVAFGVADTFIHKRPSDVRLLLAVSLLNAVLVYERPLDSYALSLRGAFLPAAFFLWLRLVRTIRPLGSLTPAPRRASVPADRVRRTAPENAE